MPCPTQGCNATRTTKCAAPVWSRVWVSSDKRQQALINGELQKKSIEKNDWKKQEYRTHTNIKKNEINKVRLLFVFFRPRSDGSENCLLFSFVTERICSIFLFCHSSMFKCLWAACGGQLKTTATYKNEKQKKKKWWFQRVITFIAGCGTRIYISHRMRPPGKRQKNGQNAHV